MQIITKDLSNGSQTDPQYNARDALIELMQNTAMIAEVQKTLEAKGRVMMSFYDEKGASPTNTYVMKEEL